jgi:bla regulator protein blaR1
VVTLRSAQREAYAQAQAPPDTPASFDVISIQTIDPAVLSVRQPGTPPLAGMSDVYFVRAGGSFRAPAISARNLIAAAFGVKSWQVVGGADWIASARFEINARTSTEVSRAQAPALMRALLTDRFRLQAHMERRPFPVFALTVARQDQRLGPQLRRSDVDCDAQRESRVPTSRIPPPPSRTERPTCSLNRWSGGMIAGAITMQELANALTGAVGSEQIVVDRTNLGGRFDVDLTWSSEPLRASGSNAAPGAAPPDDGLILSTALQEQLGLKLVLRPEPIDAVVVDHIERPSAN